MRKGYNRDSGSMAFWLPVASLWRRELVRFARDRNRLLGAIGQPMVFWLILGAGFEKSFAPVGISGGYLEYIYPGTLLLILLFTAIFSTISVIEDRREGFMQAVLVAPVSRVGLVMGKVLGGGTLAFLESAVFLVFLVFLDIPISMASLGMTLVFLAVLGIALTALGFAIAWHTSSTAGFHAVMSLFLLPMWVLSGAFFPADGASRWLAWVMAINPLTYGMDGLRQSLYLAASGADTYLWFCGMMSVGFAGVTVGTAVWQVCQKKNK